MKRTSKPRGRTRIVEVMEFNPNSFDAQFAKQNVLLEEIKLNTEETNGRVTVLERKMEGRWKYLIGGGAGISLCAMVAWELFRYLVPH